MWDNNLGENKKHKIDLKKKKKKKFTKIEILINERNIVLSQKKETGYICLTLGF